MRRLYDSMLYMQELKDTAELPLAWDRLSGTGIAISGASGMIGSFLADVLMYRNRHHNQNTDIYAIGRDTGRLSERFYPYAGEKRFHAVEWDINMPADIAVWKGKAVVPSYMIHAASHTHPVAYAADPIGTISANVLGTGNMLALASGLSSERFVFLSSVEIYGESRGDTGAFTEDYLGYIDCNTLRAGYPESKRTGEALCQAYRKQKGIWVVCPRLSRVYGPTMLLSDTKALSQFILNGVRGEDIVLKSAGDQLFSYSYVADAVSAICRLMFDGEDGAAYNVASKDSDIHLRDAAEMIARYAGRQVMYDTPSVLEAAGFSKATRAVLDTTRLRSLGWESRYDMEQGLQHTIDIVRETMDKRERL